MKRIDFVDTLNTAPAKAGAVCRIVLFLLDFQIVHLLLEEQLLILDIRILRSDPEQGLGPLREAQGQGGIRLLG